MPVKRKPSPSLHKPPGLMQVRIKGNHRYLGHYGSPEGGVVARTRFPNGAHKAATRAVILFGPVAAARTTQSVRAEGPS